MIGPKVWKDIKEIVCNGTYQYENWYSELLEHQQRLVEDMKTIQQNIGLDNLIEPQENFVRTKFIDERIDVLFPEDNFFFFKIF